MNKYFALLSVSIIAIACTPIDPIEDADYWQRTSASEAAHIRGTSAQSILNRNIAHCVAELEELNRLGQLNAPIERKPALALPQPDNHILNDLEYYDTFEECMANNGWERAITLNKNTIERADDSYKRNHIKYREKYLGKDALNLPPSHKGNNNKGDGDFDNLND